MNLRIGNRFVAAAGAVSLTLAVCFATYGIHAKLPTMLIGAAAAAICDPMPLIASFAEPIRSSHPKLRRSLRATFLVASFFTVAGFADVFGHAKLATLATAVALGTYYLFARRLRRALQPDGPNVK